MPVTRAQHPTVPPPPSAEPTGTTARLEWWMLLAAMGVVVLVYPLQVRPDWLAGTDAMLQRIGGRWLSDQVMPLLQFHHSPLVLKGVLAGVFMISFSAVYLIRRLLAPVGTAGVPAGPHPSPWSWWTWITLTVWVAVSALWSPTPELALDALVWTGLFAAFGYLLLRRGIAAEEARRLGVLFMLLGLVVIVIVYLQAFPIFEGRIFDLMYRFPGDRNRYGSLLGHNTAVGSFLLMGSFPAMVFAITARSRPRRWASVAYLAATLLAIFVVQSRAIWLLAPILWLLSARSFFRVRAGWRVLPIAGGILLLIGLILASQLIARPWNPFYLRRSPLAERVEWLMPDRLLKEARLRLNVVGATLVAERPLVGHGLYAFQYVYPKRQGEYFNRHPDSPLGRTNFRSHMAHNEYLQVAIDHGLVGLALLVGVIAELWVRGRRRRRSLKDSDRLIHEAFGWAALGFLLHAFVDFPFHIPPLMLPGLVCLAVWGAFRKPGHSEAPARPAPMAQPAPPLTLRPLVVGRLTLAMLLIPAIPVAALPLIGFHLSDVTFHQGKQLVTTFNQFPKGMPAARRAQLRAERLTRGIKTLQRAVDISPTNYLALKSLADAYMQLGLLHMGQLRESPAGRFNPHAELAHKCFEASARSLNALLRHMNFHMLYYQRAMLNRTRARLMPGKGYLEAARKDLELALLYNPDDPQAALALDRLLKQTGQADPARLLRLRKTVHRHAPALFKQYYYERAITLFEQHRYRRAADLWENILACDPDHLVYLHHAAYTAFIVGRHERAIELLDRLEALNKGYYEGYGLDLIRSPIERDWVRLLEVIKTYTTDQLEYRARRHEIEAEACRRLGRPHESTAFPKPESLTDRQWHLLLLEMRPWALHYYFSDLEGAQHAITRRLTDQEPPSIEFWLEAAWIGLELENRELTARSLEAIRELQPEHPALIDLTAHFARLWNGGTR